MSSVTFDKNSAQKISKAVRDIQSQPRIRIGAGFNRRPIHSGGVTFYKITTTGANTCTVKSLSDENGVLVETDIPGTFPCAFPCVATGKVVPTGNKFLAFKVGTIYVADPLRWLKV